MTPSDRPMGDDPPSRDSTPAPDLPSPPALPQAEAGLLGCVLTNGAWAHLVVDQVEAHQFAEEAYGALWAVVAQLVARDVPVTYTTLLEPTAAALDWPVGEVSALFGQLLKAAPTASSAQARQYATLVRDVWMRRELWHAAEEIKTRARTGAFDNTGAQILEDVEARLSRLSHEGAPGARPRTIGEAIDAALLEAQAAAEIYEAGGIVGVPSGIAAIDKKLGGWRDPDLIIVASRPGMGKTSFALRIMEAAARQFVAIGGDRPPWVLKFTLEMGAEQLATRALSSEGEVSFERIRLGHTSVADFQRLGEAAKVLRDLPIMLDDMPRLSVAAMRTRARRLKRQKGLGLVIVDYLQLVGLSREEMKEAGGNRVQEISYITRSLKILAKELGVPVIVLCQLNRDVEKREDKRPQLSDLRESGSIEQDADLVTFLYREAYYLEQRPPAKREKEKDLDFQLRRSEWSVALDRARTTSELLIAKNRHGSGGTLHLRFNPELMRFEDDTPGDASPDANQTRKTQLAMELMTAE